jgi:hypothetical protein
MSDRLDNHYIFNLGRRNRTSRIIKVMVKTYRFIALLGHGRERFHDTELDAEWPTEPIVIDAFGFSDVYRYSGYVFLSEDWFAKYTKNWQNDTS